MSACALTLAPRPCPACEAPARMIRESWSTCVGSLGPHDPNCVEGAFTCPAGHRFYATTQYVCACGWSGVKDCKISGHDRRILEARP